LRTLPAHDAVPLRSAIQKGASLRLWILNRNLPAKPFSVLDAQGTESVGPTHGCKKDSSRFVGRASIFKLEKIFVRRSLSWARLRHETGPARPRFYEPKTKSGIRTLPAPLELLSALRGWKLQCPKGELDLIFPAPTGLAAHRSNVLRYGLYRALRRAGLRRVDMRTQTQLRLRADHRWRARHRGPVSPRTLESANHA
jgi:hypothetical protein